MRSSTHSCLVSYWPSVPAVCILYSVLILHLCWLIIWKSRVKLSDMGLPWWSSSWVCLAMQGTDLIPCPGGSHMLQGSWACAPQLLSPSSGASEPQLLSPCTTSAEACVSSSLCSACCVSSSLCSQQAKPLQCGSCMLQIESGHGHCSWRDRAL